MNNKSTKIKFQSRWMQKRYDEIIRKWINNETSLNDAAGDLVVLGFTVERAWDHLQRM